MVGSRSNPDLVRRGLRRLSRLGDGCGPYPFAHGDAEARGCQPVGASVR